MKRINRRTALNVISASGLAALTATTQAAPETPAPKKEVFVLGPFSLGDWFKKYREHRKAKEAIVYGAPDDAEIIKSLHDCKLYVIDRRVWMDKDTVRFDDAKDSGPTLAATGKLIHTWKGKGKNCTIWLQGLSAIASSTDHRTPPPTRQVLLHVAIDIRGENALVTQSATHEFSSDLKYDITGKELPAER
jgi:hypothetical protein